MLDLNFILVKEKIQQLNAWFLALAVMIGALSSGSISANAAQTPQFHVC
jgi:hypothetical protein